MRATLAQINPTVGDLAGNVALALEAAHRAVAEGADLLVLPEMALIGYPPRDLLLREGVVEACEEAVIALARAVAALDPALTVVLGHPARNRSQTGRPVFNRASVLRGGSIIETYDKRLLPGYDVFDEDRYFAVGDRPCVVEVAGKRLGLLICEDLWRAEDVAESSGAPRPRFAFDPVAETVAAGADLLCVLSASPFVEGKGARHRAHLERLAREQRVPIIMVNQVGANDDLIFDGRSFIVDAAGITREQLPAFAEAVHTISIEPALFNVLDATDDDRRTAGASDDPAAEQEIWQALVLGVYDYFRKTGNARALIGLSGGLDSSLVATIAAAALGPEAITGVLMPSRYSSDHSISDAEALARNLALGCVHTIPIERTHVAFEESFNESRAALTDGPARENLQARVRGVILMSLSNDCGGLVLATGNKSELAMGYTTLYGDMCGALAVIGDLPKTKCYALSRWINAQHAALGFLLPPIPERVLTKPPSAELRPNQTDQDTLPPYDVLDAIIERYVDREASIERIIAETGFERALVERCARAIDRSEYKRRQAALILKVSPRAFGPGRPMPIVMKTTAFPALIAHQPV